MSDRATPDRRVFDHWLASELQRPVDSEQLRVERVMARVRHATPPRRRIVRNGMTSPLLPFSLAAALVLATILPPLAKGEVPAIDVSVRDTTRLFRVVLVAPDAARVAVASDVQAAVDPRPSPAPATDTSVWTRPDTTI